ncbi:hypothetical protein V6N13_034382 [Hibiscus sabdariffa]
MFMPCYNDNSPIVMENLSHTTTNIGVSFIQNMSREYTRYRIQRINGKRNTNLRYLLRGYNCTRVGSIKSLDVSSKKSLIRVLLKVLKQKLPFAWINFTASVINFELKNTFLGSLDGLHMVSMMLQLCLCCRQSFLLIHRKLTIFTRHVEIPTPFMQYDMPGCCELDGMAN